MMNRDRAKELLPIFEAFANGEEIQWRDDDFSAGWQDEGFDILDLGSDDIDIEYRIKPKPRVFWACWDGDDFDPKGACQDGVCIIGDCNEFCVAHWSHYIKVREVL